jgi:hypothetical protein
MKHTSLGRETEHQARAAAHACHSTPLHISTHVIHHCWIALEFNSSSNYEHDNQTYQLPYFSIDNAHPKLFRHSFWCADNVHDAN